MSLAVAPRTPPGRPPWSPSYLAFVLPLTAEQVLVEANGLAGGATLESRVEWAWIDLAQRLTWLYGAAGALRRLNGPGLPTHD